MTRFGQAEAERLLGDVLAPWVQALGLSVESIEADCAVLRMRYSLALCRDNGVICGQALMSLADTAMVFAVCAAAGRYRPMTTVDQSIHLLRPAVNADVLADARVLRLGKTMAFGRVTLFTDGDLRPIGTAQTAYALLAEASGGGP
jgi:uncharacterized protein (TIGR00369 family)